jgi:RNase P/RNase MRP subunit p29
VAVKILPRALALFNFNARLGKMIKVKGTFFAWVGV